MIKRGKEEIKYSECPECKSTSILYQGGSLTCRNCGHVIYKPTQKKNKYNAIKTVAKDGEKRDSKYEASVADELYMRKLAGDILDYESQYRVDMPIFNENGKQVMLVRHKIDFRVHERDGSYTLLEAKGVETADYKWRRSLLEKIWLPAHPDHVYEVRKQINWGRKR